MIRAIHAPSSSVIRRNAGFGYPPFHASGSKLRALKYAKIPVAPRLLLALNTLTNYVNEVVKTVIDFPIVSHRST
jgi:hypothetical protein